MFDRALSRLFPPITIATIIVVMAFAMMPVARSQSSTGDAPFERIVWRLAAYAADGTMATVPTSVRTTLFLDGTKGSGSAGCDDFEVPYVADEVSLTFGEPAVRTDLVCEEGDELVEAAFLDALRRVAAWSIHTRVLSLADGDGNEVLRFEVATSDVLDTELFGVTASLANLDGQVAALRDELDTLRVPRLRDRVAGLEGVVASLGDRLDQQRLLGLRTRVGGIELTLRESIERFTTLRARVRRLEDRVAAIEASVEIVPEDDVQTDSPS